MNSSFRLLSGRLFHGDGGDQIGQVGAFFNGTGRFRVLWDDDKIRPEFGILAGLSKDAIRKVISYSTLTNGAKKRITGRQLVIKAKASIKDCKVLLAYWNDYTKNGGYPSGKNETDALTFCIESVATENTQNMEKEGDTEDEDEEDEPAVTQPLRSAKPLSEIRRSVVESDEEENEDDAEAEDEGDEEEDDNDTGYISRKSVFPAALVTFMLLGPYGTAAYGFEISAAFTMNTKAIEENAKTGMYNSKSMKEEKKAAMDLTR
jgi:hypothetical protein